jgi:bifunctional N-acetylglucosamine-1-phosphate-uridyltransferase/glucosamine-1-phosphate-acetyltransferase GlmU-like protein
MTGALPEIGCDNWQQSASPGVDPELWTAVIPAAGRGARLGFHRPKILYPVAGRPILDWLLDFLQPNCSELVFVLSPDGAADVSSELDRRLPGRYKVVIQETPTGMGDAVALALPQVRTAHVAIVWGDQVALRRRSVEACLRLQQGPLAPDMTCPTVMRDRPYIHFQRDAQGRIAALLEAREGDVMPARGESDTGFFCFRTPVVIRLLEELRRASRNGRGTGEFNFLPVIPLAADQGTVITPHLMSVEETVGVNSAEDASRLEEFLRRTHASDEC